MSPPIINLPMKFQTEQIMYLNRLKKEFLFGFLFVTGIIIFVHLENGDIYEPTKIIVAAVMILVTGIGLAFAAHLTGRRYIYEVKLMDETIILRGDTMNKALTVKLPISDTEIFVKSKGRGRGNVEYFIRFKHKSKTFDINRLFNWNYTTLLELFHKFKEQKKEKIIWDEKYLLEFMEKKSRGMSSFQIAFGKNEKDTPKQRQ